MTLRDGMRRKVGGRFRMGNKCTPMADSCEKKKSKRLKVLVFRIKKHSDKSIRKRQIN